MGGTVGNISVIETSQDSCVGDTVNLIVNISEVPYASAIAGDFVLCEDNVSVSYSITGLPGSTFTWLVSNGMSFSGVDMDSISICK